MMCLWNTLTLFSTSVVLGLWYVTCRCTQPMFSVWLTLVVTCTCLVLKVGLVLEWPTSLMSVTSVSPPVVVLWHEHQSSTSLAGTTDHVTHRKYSASRDRRPCRYLLSVWRHHSTGVRSTMWQHGNEWWLEKNAACGGWSASWGYDTIRYDTIEEINVDSKAEYTA